MGGALKQPRPANESRSVLIDELQERLGHRFANLGLLEQALTHSSLANERPSGAVAHNEALEFLGDSVLGFLVAEMLHRRDPGGPEGNKSKVRAQLVAAPSLARRAERLGVPAALRMGRGEEKTGGRNKAALWADAYEAVIAALYLDGGLTAAARFVDAEFAADVDQGLPDTVDFKSTLQERLQARGEPVPEYLVASETGPSHRRTFRIHCVVGGRVAGAGEGASKKAAQQEAARQALLDLAGS
jgi:ribonuclease-3